MGFAVGPDRYRSLHEPLDHPAMLVALAVMWAGDRLRSTQLTAAGLLPEGFKFAVTVEQAAITSAKVSAHIAISL